MKDHHADTSRRTFLRTMSLAGAVITAPVGWGIAGASEKAHECVVESPFFRVHFDSATGRFYLFQKGGGTLVSGGIARAITDDAVFSTADTRYERTVEATPVKDRLGSGQQLRATCIDGQGRLDFSIQVTVYENRNAAVLEVTCRNTSSDTPLVMGAMEPLRAVADADGWCAWPGMTRVLTNGRMYYDPGKVAEFTPGEPLESWWNVGLHAGDRRPGMALGYLENNHAMGQLHLVRDANITNPDAFSLVVTSGYQRDFTLRPGDSVSSDRFVFCTAEDSYTALEDYAQCMADAHTIHLNPVANGWCSWFQSYEGVTEEDVLHAAQFAARHLKPYGMEYVQVDDGFYRAFGDWEGNEKFPHGMKWLAGQIRDLGLKPGIWLAPYVISEGTDIHLNHPKWLIRKANGDLRPVRPGSRNEDDVDTGGRKRYALDISHPDAAEWLGRLLDTAANDWGYDFIKIDFVDWSLLAAERYYDPTATRASLYRKGAEIMRRAMGPNRHLLDCGPGQLSAGYLDSMRIELDQPPVNWEQYFLNPESSAPAAAKRYYFHNRLWINDADHIVLAMLTIPQAQAAATTIAMSGGTTFSGDRLPDLDAVRLDILRRVLPAYGQAARPVDLWENDHHELFALTVSKPFAEWIVLAVFNAEMEAPKEKTVFLERLGLDPNKVYLAYNFWEQSFFGEISREIKLTLPPSSVALLAIHEKRDEPQLLSTDRHVLQGAIELENIAWEKNTGTVSGVSLGQPGTDHNVFIRLPHEHEWTQKDHFFFHDRESFTFKMMERGILRVHARFEKSERVAWSVNLRDLFPNDY